MKSENYCDYGCGNIATHTFKNGKHCCEKDYRKCPGFRNQISKSLKGCETWNKGKANIYSEETLEKMKSSHLGENNYWFGKKLTNEHKDNIRKGHIGKTLSKEHRKNLSHALKGNTNAKGLQKRNINRLTIDLIKKRYPLFSKIEAMRYDPDNIYDIQFHCKNHNCENSKEKGGWFTPTYIQFYERVRCIERQGVDNSYLYCCDECKEECPLYNFTPTSNIKKIENDNYRTYTESEYQTFRQYVLERDNYKCQYCGEHAEHVHHERPQKLEPFHSLDPDFAWSVCQKCHYKYGHNDECSLVNLSLIDCTKKG